MVALVSKRAVLVRVNCQLVALSVASPRVIRTSSDVTRTPGALITIVWVSTLFVSDTSSIISLGSMWNDRSTSPSAVGVQFHERSKLSPGDIETVLVDIRVPSARAMTSRSGTEPAPRFWIVTVSWTSSPICGIGVDTTTPGRKAGSGERSLTLTPRTARAKDCQVRPPEW